MNWSEQLIAHKLSSWNQANAEDESEGRVSGNRSTSLVTPWENGRRIS